MSKRILVVSLVLVSLVSLLLAKSGKKDMACKQIINYQEYVDKLADVLVLTADQKEEVTAILKKKREKFEALMEKKKALNAKYDKKVEAVLTEEQVVKFNEYKVKRKMKHEKKMKDKKEHKQKLERMCKDLKQQCATMKQKCKMMEEKMTGTTCGSVIVENKEK